MKHSSTRSNDGKIEARWQKLAPKIERYAPLLARQGRVVAKKIKGRTYWCLRIVLPRDAEGRRRHASVHIGRESDAELVYRTRLLLDYYRQRHVWLTEAAVFGRLIASLLSYVQSHIRKLRRTRKR